MILKMKKKKYSIWDKKKGKLYIPQGHQQNRILLMKNQAIYRNTVNQRIKAYRYFYQRILQISINKMIKSIHKKL